MNRIFSTIAFTTLMLGFAVSTHAGTILKLGLSTDSRPDIELIDGLLSTADDGIGATTGDQNTEVTFLGTLIGQPIIESDNASFSLNGVNLVDMPTIFGTTVLHSTEGGTFSLYDPSNNVLLGGTLGHGTLSGPIGGTATGGFLTTEFGSFTEGSLLSVLDPIDLLRSSFSITLNDVNGGAGFTTNGDGELDNFKADAIAIIGAQEVPEPTGVLLMLMGSIAVLGLRRSP